MTITPLDCVVEAPPNASGALNHIEVQVSQNQIDVYATDAGVTPTVLTLHHIAVIKNVNLTFSRGLVWFEDGHYNADKGSTPNPDGSSQKQHTFAWDNIAFDGPSSLAILPMMLQTITKLIAMASYVLKDRLEGALGMVSLL